MKTEYKRDMNHNYLIFHSEDEIHTDSYQTRMLVGNVIPSLLKCRIQGVDGRYLVYFDITSKQSVGAFYQDKKFKVEDLQMIFGGFVQVMEDAAEYLMDPEQLLLSPEYILIDIEKHQVYFCMMPGCQKDIKGQFQLLAEYMLPKIDHEDQAAVALGYGIYRHAIEESFHLEHVKEELYKRKASVQMKTEEFTEKEDAEIWNIEERCEVDKERSEKYEKHQGEADATEYDFFREATSKKKESLLRQIGIFLVALVILAGIIAASIAGYLPYMETETVLGIILVGMGAVLLAFWILKKKQEKTPQTQNGDLPKHREYEPSEPRDNKSRELFGMSVDVKNKKISRKPDLKENGSSEDFGETVVLSAGVVSGPASLVSREAGEFATIYLNEELTVIGKLENACDAVIELPTVSRIHAKVRKRDGNYYLSDMNSRNGTSVNGRLLLPEEEYQLQSEDEVDFAQARYIFLE